MNDNTHKPTRLYATRNMTGDLLRFEYGFTGFEGFINYIGQEGARAQRELSETPRRGVPNLRLIEYDLGQSDVDPIATLDIEKLRERQSIELYDALYCVENDKKMLTVGNYPEDIRCEMPYVLSRLRYAENLPPAVLAKYKPYRAIQSVGSIRLFTESQSELFTKELTDFGNNLFKNPWLPNNLRLYWVAFTDGQIEKLCGYPMTSTAREDRLYMHNFFSYRSPEKNDFLDKRGVLARNYNLSSCSKDLMKFIRDCGPFQLHDDIINAAFLVRIADEGFGSIPSDDWRIHFKDEYRFDAIKDRLNKCKSLSEAEPVERVTKQMAREILKRYYPDNNFVPKKGAPQSINTTKVKVVNPVIGKIKLPKQSH